MEDYLVPHMSVPILLGKDYQLNYKLTVKRSVEKGTNLLYGDDKWYSVKAVSVDKTNDFG